MPQAWIPPRGELEKKVVFSPCRGDETTTYHDRAFVKSIPLRPRGIPAFSSHNLLVFIASLLHGVPRARTAAVGETVKAGAGGGFGRRVTGRIKNIRGRFRRRVPAFPGRRNGSTNRYAMLDQYAAFPGRRERLRKQGSRKRGIRRTDSGTGFDRCVSTAWCRCGMFRFRRRALQRGKPHPLSR